MPLLDYWYFFNQGPRRKNKQTNNQPTKQTTNQTNNTPLPLSPFIIVNITLTGKPWLTSSMSRCVRVSSLSEACMSSSEVVWSSLSRLPVLGRRWGLRWGYWTPATPPVTPAPNEPGHSITDLFRSKGWLTDRRRWVDPWLLFKLLTNAYVNQKCVKWQIYHYIFKKLKNKQYYKGLSKNNASV